MGWYFDMDYRPRREYIKELLEERVFKKPDGRVMCSVPLAHCYRGNPGAGTLWSVWERTIVVRGVCLESSRWIGCDLLRFHAGDRTWGHKPLSESEGPCSWSCPLGYLAMVPEDQPGVNLGWRQAVREHHARRKAKTVLRQGQTSTTPLERVEED